MGKQIQFHILQHDCSELIAFAQQRDPVIVIPYTAESPLIREVQAPCEGDGWFCLWNQALLPAMEYKHILNSDHGPYYRVDDCLPVLEFTKSVEVEWNGKPALTQGRIYTPFECPEDQKAEFGRWYDGLVRWIRKNWMKNPVPLLGGYVGSAAFDAYKRGVTLLPMFTPPLTPQWLSWSTAQDSLRSVE